MGNRPWTDEDHRQLRAFEKSGLAIKLIAARLGRSYSAVCTRRELLEMPRRVRRSKAVKVIAPVATRETARIARAEVPLWYELGWRFVRFDGDFCIFEWPHAGEVLRPIEMRQAA